MPDPPQMRDPFHYQPQRALASIAVASTLATVGLGLVACGSDDSTLSSSTHSEPSGQLNAAQLASTADSLCSDATDRIAAQAEVPDFGKNGLQSDEVKASTEFWKATATEQTTTLAQLSDLQPPDDEAKRWDQFLDLYKTGRVKYAKDLAKPAARGDQEKFFDVGLAAQTSLTQLDRLSQALGMKICGASSLPTES
jgi:hypothetical protein